MSDLRALLMTQVVGSLELNVALGDAAMSDAWAAHDRAARDLLRQWNGYETEKGSGMLLSFERASDAVGYARRYHQVLADLTVPLKAQAAIHFGSTVARDAGDVGSPAVARRFEPTGPAKRTLACACSVSHPGQTLLTDEARKGLAGAGLRLRSHGHWLVEGAAEPHELFEVDDTDALWIQPVDNEQACQVWRDGTQWARVRDIANNLPHQGTRFIGREREVADVVAQLGKARIVTLLGMGGLGKTRLSLQVATAAMSRFPDGVWFVDLAPLRDKALVISEAARVLDVAEEPGRPLLQTLCAHLKARRTLLILDNCEHLIQPAADLAHAVVRGTEHVAVIATSREPLRVPGEHVRPVMPLPVPARGDSLKSLSRSVAVRIFVERVRDHRRAFELSEREAPSVAEIAARLEGIPLALELAAARARIMSVSDINERLRERFKMLASGSRSKPERQRTLRATIDWSYDLLTDPERLLLRRLAVFRGGMDLAAVESVCGTEPIDALDVLGLLALLVDRSLLIMEEHETGSRYRILETIREYAQEKLVADGDEAAAVAARHCEYYFQFAKDARDGLDGAEQGKWLLTFERELDNLRAATALSMSEGVDPVIAVKLIVALQGYWIMRGDMSEGRRLINAVLAMPAIQGHSLARAHALYVGAALAINQGDPVESLAMAETARDLHRQFGEGPNYAAALSTLAKIRLDLGDTEGARVDNAQAIELFRSLGDRLGELICLSVFGQIALSGDETDPAREQLLAGLVLAREVESPELEGTFELLLGEVDLETGSLDAAHERLSRALEVARAGADSLDEAKALWRLGSVALARGAEHKARQHFGEALRRFQAAQMWKELLGCLEEAVQLALLAGAPEQAARIAATTDSAWRRTRLCRRPAVQARWDAQLATLRSLLGAKRFEACWNEASAAWSTDDAIRAALAVPQGSTQ